MSSREADLRDVMRGRDVVLRGNAPRSAFGGSGRFVIGVNVPPTLRHTFDALYLGPGTLLEDLPASLHYVAYSGLHAPCHLGESQVIASPYYAEASMRANPYGYDAQWSNTLCRELQTLPLTGIIAIAHLLTLPISSLLLTGFDFYSISSGVLPVMRDSHYIPPQVEWLRRILRTDTRVTADRSLTELLAHDIVYLPIQQGSTGTGVETREVRRVIV